MELTAFVITLRRSTERAAQVAKLIAQCSIRCCVWDAVDGSELSREQQSAVYRPRLHTPPYPFVLKPGEIGCFLSHRGLWQEMVERSIPQALILEDDVELLSNFNDSLQFASDYAGPSDYIQFQVRDLQPRGQVMASDHHRKILRPSLIPLRTSAQLVTLGAAEKLLRHTKIFDRPVDAYLQMNWLHGVRVLMTHPRSVHEVSARLGGSTIGASRRRQGALSTISRQWRRAVYRLRIATHATAERISHTTELRTCKDAPS